MSLALAVPSRQRVELTVFDIGGRRVATIFDGWLDAGAQPLHWNGRGDDGSPAGAGLYLVRLRAESGQPGAGKNWVRRLALIR